MATYVKTCKGCGKTFTTDKFCKLYCSDECQQKLRSAWQREYAARKKAAMKETAMKEAGETRVCPYCGKAFEAVKNDKVYCSAQCRVNDHYGREAGAIKRKNTRVCHDCGRPTHDYRCAKCWAKLRRKMGLAVDIENQGQA